MIQKMTFLLVSMISISSYAISPSQYCQAIEQKKSGSFEVLNIIPDASKVGTYSAVTLIKFCMNGKFCAFSHYTINSALPRMDRDETRTVCHGANGGICVCY